MTKDFYVSLQSAPQSRVSALQCGREDCEPLHAFGPFIRDHWLLHYVERGSGRFSIGGRDYELHPGEVFLIPPNCNTFYQADEKNPWSYRWVGLWGDGVGAVYAAAGLTVDHPVKKADPKVGKAIGRIISCAHDPGIERVNLLESIYSFLRLFLPSGAAREENDTSGYYVQRAENYIRQYLYRKITVEEVADEVNVDRSYLSALFKKEKGISTQQFILQVKLKAARDYLEQTDYDISRIAKSVGYEDSFTFSHVFNRVYGISPTAWRREKRR